MPALLTRIQPFARTVAVRYLLLGALVLSADAPAMARTTPEQNVDLFEVASIRPNKIGGIRRPIRRLPGGRLEAVNVALRDLIHYAYALTRFAAVEGTSSVLDERFDVIATAGQDWPTAPRFGPFNMALQRLLAERFQLTVHRDTRTTPGFALVLARQDGRLGPQLRPSAVDCALLLKRGEAPALRPDGSSICTISGRNGQVRAGGHTMVDFASFLQNLTNAPVDDRTGLSGPFEIDASFTYIPPNLPSNAGLVDGSPGTPPDLHAALPDQLGLRLERQDVAIEILVVDRAEPPSEN